MRVSPPGGAAVANHGPQTSVGQEVGIPTHWGSSVNSGAVGDWSIYRPLPEHVREINCDLSYHELVFGGGAEAGNAPIQVIGGASRHGYHEDQGGAGICIGGVGGACES